MIEPVNIPIILDLELAEEELELSFEEAEEYAAQIGSLITISEVYGGLPSEGIAGDILIKNSEEDYDASWCAPASVVEDGNGLPVTSGAVYDAVSVKYTKPSDGIPASDLADDVHLIPSGGTIGQILRKISNSDWDIEWADESGGGSNFVEYGTGTNAQIEAFYQAGQMCACIRSSGYVLPLVLRVSASYHVFSAAYNNTVYMALCRNNEWWTVTRELAKLSDIPIVDNALSDTSENPVQNKAIKAALDTKGTYSKPSDGIPASDLSNDVYLVPSGGTISQVLRKRSNTDNDIEWANENNVWWTYRIYTSFTYDDEKVFSVYLTDLQSGSGVAAVGDIVLGPANGTGDIDSFFIITSISIAMATLIPIATFATGYNLRRNASTLIAKTALYRYQICFTVDKETVVPVNAVNNKPTTYTKALTTESWDPFGPIYYYGTTSTIAADATVSASYMWLQYSGVDLRYSFNEGTTLTANNDIYIVCVLQNDGKVKLHSSPISQTLPTTDDGLLYLKLGRTYDTYRIALDMMHPIYYFKEGKIRLYTGEIKSHELPSGGTAGQLLVKQSDSDYNVAWISPASSAEQDNTRPITAAAVYTEIGNINALLATI